MCTLACQCHTYQTTEGSFSLRSRLDETCGHVVSILFKAQAAVMMRLHQTSVTSSTRTWNNKFKKRAHAERISSMLTLSGRHTKCRTVPTGPAALCVEKLQKKEEVVEFWAVQGCAFMTCVDETGSMAQKSSGLPCVIMKILWHVYFGPCRVCVMWRSNPTSCLHFYDGCDINKCDSKGCSPWLMT